MKKFYLSFATGILAMTMNAQQYVHQVIFLNEGKYDYYNNVQVSPVTLGTYNPSTKVYSQFATIPNARFGSDVVVDESSIYVAADSLLLKYNKSTMQLSYTRTVKGIRKLALWNDKILVTRGDVTPFNSYFQVYDKNYLNFIFELDTSNGPLYPCEGIGVVGDTAFIAVSNSFDWGNYVGKIGMVDLNAQGYLAEIDLGPNGKNPDNMMIDGNYIYTLNNEDWNESSVTIFNTITKDTITKRIAGSGGCGSSAFADSHVYYMEYNVGKLARFNVGTKAIVDTLQNTLPFYGMATDEINSIIYATSTDYSTSGKAFIMQYNGILTDSFDVGISAGTIALDVRSALGVGESSASGFRIQINPNPSNGKFQLSTPNAPITDLVIHNILGEKIYESGIQGIMNGIIDISNQPDGIYFLTLKTENGMVTEKLIKQ